LVVEELVEFVVQVNGKVRDRLMPLQDAPEASVISGGCEPWGDRSPERAGAGEGDHRAGMPGECHCLIARFQNWADLLNHGWPEPAHPT
jgi:hypothetical protein